MYYKLQLWLYKWQQLAVQKLQNPKTFNSFISFEDKDKMIKLKSLVPVQFAPNPTYPMMVNIYPTYIYTLSHTGLICIVGYNYDDLNYPYQYCIQ